MRRVSSELIHVEKSDFLFICLTKMPGKKVQIVIYLQAICYMRYE